MRAHPEADAEAREAMLWYEERSFLAADNFLSELDHYREHITTHPLAGHPCYGVYRRLNLKTFPFALIYRPDGDSIYLIAVMHEKRHPDYWKHRTEDDQF